MPVQTTYQENLDAARAGLISGSDFASETGIVETDAGIGFGLAVAQGVGDKGIILGGTTTTFRGISIRDVTLGAELDTYEDGKTIGVLTRGTVWVVPSGDVTANAAVYFTAATGRLSATSGGNVLVKGARWLDSAATDGFARVYLSGLVRGVDA